VFARDAEWEGIVTLSEGPFPAHPTPGSLIWRILGWMISLVLIGALGVIWMVRRCATSFSIGPRPQRSGRSFFGDVASHVTGSVIAERVFGVRRDAPTRNVRLRLDSGAVGIARLEGDVVAGAPASGDRVRLRGRLLRGTLLVRRGWNLTTGTDIALREA
jgi:hypothetical protein